MSGPDRRPASSTMQRFADELRHAAETFDEQEISLSSVEAFRSRVLEVAHHMCPADGPLLVRPKQRRLRAVR